MMLSACTTVTIQPVATAPLVSKPDYQSSKDFFLWGLIGKRKVDVNLICKGQGAKQMQTVQTFKDGVWGAITLGVYTPHTVKIWCHNTKETSA